MKKVLIALLLLHVVLEGGLGLVLIIAPQMMVPEADINAVTALITYGAAAVTMAAVVLWLWPHRHNAAVLCVALGVLATFHTALVVAAIAITLQGGDGAPLLIHVLLAAGFWWLWLKRNRLATAG